MTVSEIRPESASEWRGMCDRKIEGAVGIDWMGNKNIRAIWVNCLAF